MSVSDGEHTSAAIDNRPERYATLFRGELSNEPLCGEIELSISALCRAAHRGGWRSEELQDLIDNLPELIDTILEEHDLAAMGEGDQAIFAFINDEDREIVGDIVSNVFTQWEVTYERNHLEPILADERGPARWLVIETAAAVMAAASRDNSFDLHKNTRDRRDIAKIISCWGPEFTRQWFNGAILGQWADRQSLSIEERSEWLEAFTPGIYSSVLL